MEFLFDDEWIDRTAGVRRVLGAPRKGPEPVLAPAEPWEAGGLSLSPALLFDPEAGRFRLWYRSAAPESPGAPAGARRHFLCYAESDDGASWKRPDLGRHPFGARRDTNVLLELAAGDSVFYNVLRDPDDPDPARRYKALGFDRGAVSAVPGAVPGTLGVCVAYSRDGLEWRYGEGQPRLVLPTDEVTDADCVLGRRDPATGRWTAFLRPRTHPKRRFVGHAESDDFERWTPPRMLLTPAAADGEHTEFYGLAVACVGRWRVGALWVFRNHPAFSPLTAELVSSRDGRHYRRAAPGEPFLPLGGGGAWDSRMVTPLAIVERGAEHLVFYRGANHDHGSDRGQPMSAGRTARGEARVAGLGLARLPWGQFCGLRADADGLVETKWLCRYGAGGVKAVCATDPGGRVEAELLDHLGRVIPGRERARSRWRPGAAGAGSFCWGEDGCREGDREDGGGGPPGPAGGRRASEPGGPVGHVVKLRVYLHRATLFAFGVGADAEAPPG